MVDDNDADDDDEVRNTDFTTTISIMYNTHIHSGNSQYPASIFLFSFFPAEELRVEPIFKQQK